MRKLLSVLILSGVAFGAQRAVLLEIFGADWCPYCPSASLAGDSLKKEYKDTLTVVDYVDNVSGSEADVRFSYYSIYYIPDGWIDAVTNYVGGSPYGQYKTRIESRKTIPSPVRLENVQFWQSGDTLYATATVVLEENLDQSKFPRIYAVVTERNVVAFDDGTRSDHLMRDFLSSPYGEDLSVFNAGESEDFSWSVVRSSAWTDTLDLAVWVQYYPTSSREVLQSKQVVLGTLAVSESPAEAPSLVCWLPNGLFIKGQGSEFQLRLYDASGRQVLSTKGTLNGQTVLPLNDLPKGLYVAVVKLDGKTFTVSGVR